jgi:hypothetical protein
MEVPKKSNQSIIFDKQQEKRANSYAKKTTCNQDGQKKKGDFLHN